MGPLRTPLVAQHDDAVAEGVGLDQHQRDFRDDPIANDAQRELVERRRESSTFS
jgi:hypothetical protein